MKYGDRIAYLREQNNLTQQQLADKIGITRASLSHYEKNRREPDYKTLEKLADFFEVSIDYLLGRTDNPTTNSNTLPELTAKDEKDIAKKLESILESMDSDTGLAFDGEPLDEETKQLVRAAIESNLQLTKQLAKKKFTPKKYRK